MHRSRKLAAHQVKVEPGVQLTTTSQRLFAPGIVTVEQGRVIHCSTLTHEQAHTEWLGGTIVIRLSADGIPRAYQDEELIIDH